VILSSVLGTAQILFNLNSNAMYLQNLQQDEIFVPSEMKSLKSLTQMESRRGLENVIISNGKIVNVVSNSYGHIPNQLFFRKLKKC